MIPIYLYLLILHFTSIIYHFIEFRFYFIKMRQKYLQIHYWKSHLSSVLSEMFTLRPLLLLRAGVNHWGSDQSARPCRLLRSLHLPVERKPRPQHHLALQRRARQALPASAGVRLLAGHHGRDAAGRGDGPVSAGQRDRISAVSGRPHHAVRYQAERLQHTWVTAVRFICYLLQ